MLNPKEQIEVNKYSNSIDFIPLNYDTIPTYLKYNRKKFSKNVHIGQRKLLLGEIYFLTKYGNLSNHVVYAGAASGQHIPFLSQLFPNHIFHLWDPAPFAIKSNDKIFINNNYFTNEVAELYKDKSPLFICDIRSGSESMKFEEFEAEVDKNNQMQRKWIEIINPKMSMVKFRVPYGISNSNAYEYLNGEICIQAWAPPFSGETRLITDGKSKRIYREYEAKMHYVNIVIRPYVKYNSLLVLHGVNGISNSFDCSYEIYIWILYAKKFIKEDIDIWISNQINSVSELLHRNLK